MMAQQYAALYGAMDAETAALYGMGDGSVWGAPVASPMSPSMMNFGSALAPPGSGGGYGARGVPGSKGAAKGRGVKQEMGAVSNVAPKDTSAIDDAIFTAAGTALKDLFAHEKEWDFDTLKWRVTKYFKTAAKGIDWGKGSYEDRINEYADTAFGTLTWVLNDRKWMRDADFTIVLEVAVHELFPEEHRIGVSPAELEDAILRAHDRAFEEKRVAPVIWEAVQALADSKKAQQKVYNAAELGRKNGPICDGAAAEFAINHVDEDPSYNGPFWEKVKEFVASWVHTMVQKLFDENGEYVPDMFPEEACVKFFQRICDEGALPRAMMLDLGIPIPEPWHFLTVCIKDAYFKYAPPPQPPKEKKIRAPPAGYKEELCWYFAAGHCSFAKACFLAHGELELRGKGLFVPQEIPTFKAEMCHFFRIGKCKFGVNCMMAHGKQELQTKVAETTLPVGTMGSPLSPGLPPFVKGCGKGGKGGPPGYGGGPIRPLPPHERYSAKGGVLSGKGKFFDHGYDKGKEGGKFAAKGGLLGFRQGKGLPSPLSPRPPSLGRAPIYGVKGGKAVARVALPPRVRLPEPKVELFYDQEADMGMTDLDQIGAEGEEPMDAMDDEWGAPEMEIPEPGMEGGLEEGFGEEGFGEEATGFGDPEAEAMEPGLEEEAWDEAEFAAPVMPRPPPKRAVVMPRVGVAPRVPVRPTPPPKGYGKGKQACYGNVAAGRAMTPKAPPKSSQPPAPKRTRATYGVSA